MKRTRHTPAQIIRKLPESDKLLGQGKTIEEVARHLEITESTWHRWQKQYGGMKADDAKRLKELERENARLKKLLAEAELDKFGVSQRRACKVIGQHRSTQRLVPPPITDEEQLLRAWLRGFSVEAARWGWRRVATMAPKEGWKVNNKRIQRLWRVDIDPGSPWQNACIESFNGRLRDEHLNGQRFDSLFEAKVLPRGLADRL